MIPLQVLKSNTGERNHSSSAGTPCKETRFHQHETSVGAEGPGPNTKCDLQALTALAREAGTEIQAR